MVVDVAVWEDFFGRHSGYCFYTYPPALLVEMGFLLQGFMLTLHKVAMEIDGGAAAKPLTTSALKRLAAKQRPRKRVSKSQKSIVFKNKVVKGKGDSIGRVGRVAKRKS